MTHEKGQTGPVGPTAGSAISVSFTTDEIKEFVEILESVDDEGSTDEGRKSEGLKKYLRRLQSAAGLPLW